jgi:hypothetical protein
MWLRTLLGRDNVALVTTVVDLKVLATLRTSAMTAL